ncbi:MULTISPECIES: TrbI/VirB10 family protein [Pseudomonas syringae group]|uniref:Type IV secretion system protein VirB10 n=1 Tax=Pseudomonas syringae TaxID=317 RepID=A0AB38C1K7_PSESX|nr:MULTISPECIES: TrbI/VirB10 family protein [Pseudomonas syringae group]MCK0551180.1 conjugal transfer protein [Pseudomonas syringae pv. aptata]UBT82414.1 conjugal transfer protein [Pseudomonas amygdali]SFO57197.1 type IV secretion system protein VirB10 [Pseudomonas syringae]SFP07105.1 type IV secretion system protein VirB10 [Pseudomonas syringae]
MQNNDNDQAPVNTPGPDSIGPPESAATTAAPEQAPASEPASTQARGAFDVRAKRTGDAQNKKSLYLGLAGLVFVGLLVIGGLWYFTISQMKTTGSEVDETNVKKDATLDVNLGSDDSMKKAREAKLAADKAEEEKRARAERDRLAKEEKDKRDANRGSTDQGHAASVPPPPGQNTPVVETPRQRKLGAAMFVTSEDAMGTGAADTQPQQPSTNQPSGMPSLLDGIPGGSSGDLGGESSTRKRSSLSDLGGTTFAPAKAYLAPNRKYLVSHNTYTRCALYTEIISTHPGMVDCRLTDPLYSADGSTVIAEAGDKLTGEQTVQVGPGETSVFTTWTELETRSGTRAKLDSLGAGPMGASGTEAWIDRHYMQRFGGAVMLSFIQDALQAASNTTQKSSGSGGYTVNNSEQNVESMANKALDSTINIPDTGKLLPGTVITVIVARDIDFSSVFENR